MGSWRFAEQTDVAGVRESNRLVTERAGLQLRRVGRFLYAIGGRDDTGAVLGTTERAEILGQSSAPGIQFARLVLPSDADFTSACSGNALLPAGTYRYRIAAVGARGEGLASSYNFV